MGFLGFKSREEKKREAEEKARQEKIREASGTIVEQKGVKTTKKDNDRKLLNNQRAQEIRDELDKKLRNFTTECQRMDCDPDAIDRVRDRLLPQIRTLSLGGDLFDAETVASFVAQSVDSVLLAVKQGDTYAAVIGINFIQEWIGKLSTPGFTQHFRDPKYVKACKNQLLLKINIEAAQRQMGDNRALAQKIQADYQAGTLKDPVRAQDEINKLKTSNAGLKNKVANWNAQLDTVNAIIEQTELVNVSEEAGSVDLATDMDELLDKKADLTADLNAAIKKTDKLRENNLASTSASITAFSDNSVSASSDEPVALDLTGI